MAKLKVPKAPKKILKTLSEEEIGRLFVSLGQNTSGGCRDAAMLLLFFDTGLGSSELLHLIEQELHFANQWLKVMGKGQKERIVPFGNQASKLLHRYFDYFRPEPLFDDQFFLCVDGSPMTENTIKLIFARIAKRAGIPRLHIHLLRHTFATRYLLDGGDVFSLQRILGHTSLEMTRRYVDMAAMETTVKQKRMSAMDRIFLKNKGVVASPRNGGNSDYENSRPRSNRKSTSSRWGESTPTRV